MLFIFILFGVQSMDTACSSWNIGYGTDMEQRATLYNCTQDAANVTCRMVLPECVASCLANINTTYAYISHVTLFLNNKHYYFSAGGQRTPIINLTNLQLMAEYLETFQIFVEEKENAQLYFFNVSDDVFAKMENLARFTLAVTTSADVTTDFFNKRMKTLPALQRLDLSSTRSIDPEVVRKLVQHYHNNLTHLSLQNFQTKGHMPFNINCSSASKGCYQMYLSVLNITDYFCGNASQTSDAEAMITYPQLEFLDLSQNGLDRIDPGISVAFPQLKVLNVSFNYFIDGSTTTFFLECIWHESLELLYYDHQGYVEYTSKPPFAAFASNASRDVQLPMHIRERRSASLFSYPKDHELGGLHDIVKCLNFTRPKNLTHLLCQVYMCIGFSLSQVIKSCDEFFSCLVHRISGGNATSSEMQGDKIKHYLLGDEHSEDDLLDYLYESPRPNKSIKEYLENIATDLLCYFAQCAWFSGFHGISCSHIPNITRFFSSGEDAKCPLHLQFPIGQNLTHLAVSFLGLQQGANTLPDMVGKFCLESNNITHLVASNNYRTFKTVNLREGIEKGEMLGFDNVEFVDLSFNKLNTSVFHLIKNLDNIQELHLHHNLIDVSRDHSVCKSNIGAKLTHLNLAVNNITELPINFIANCRNLQVLNLSGNQLSSSTLFFKLPNMPKNLTIDLSNNDLHPALNQRFLDEVASTNNVQIVLDYRNNFKCNCQTQNFIYWLKRNSNKIKVSYGKKLKCEAAIGIIDIDTYQSTFRKCYQRVFILLCLALTAILVLLLALAWFYRLKLRYHMFSARRWWIERCSSSAQDLGQTSWEFDVFVAFCDVDRNWVIGALMPELEKKHGFKLCVYLRDFPLGGTIPDTVISYMSKSREILLVVSENFVTRDWCIFEVNEALRLAARRRSQLLIIKLGNIYLEERVVQPVIRHLLERYLYIEWPEKVEKQQEFWDRLVTNLYRDQHASCCCCCGTAQKVASDPHVAVINESNDEHVPESSEDDVALIQEM